MTQALQLAAGVALLYWGGEWLVEGATALARRWGVRPMVVGLTVVAVGTSTPELFASLAAAVRGSPDIALGNVVGSNVANVGLILGITALISPIFTRARFVRREVAFMVGVLVLALLLILGGGVNRGAGLILVGLLPIYMLILLRGQEEPEVEEEFEREYGDGSRRKRVASWLRLAASLLLLASGADQLVSGATGVARALGASEFVIGLSMVAAGTSLPELFASVVAAARKEPDIALGNVVGSNVLNILFVLGPTALVSPIAAPADGTALPQAATMVGFSLVLVPFLLTGLRLGRREGGFLLVGYAAYIYYLYTFQ